MSDMSFTEWVNLSMEEFSERIYEIEDGISSIEDNEQAIIDYLKNISYSNTIGLQLRRYMCEKFSSGRNAEDGGWLFTLSDSRKLSVGNYLDENYNIEEDDIPEYTEIFLDINQRFNSDENGELTLVFPRPEVRRLLRASKRCQRSKVFTLSFALHMEAADVNKVLTDTIAEQTYNFRDPYEVIAFFCQSHNEYNSYSAYLRLKEQYDKLYQSYSPSSAQKEEYTRFAAIELSVSVKTEEELLKFLENNIPNFSGYSKTLYSEFEKMVDELIYDGYCRSENEAMKIDDIEQRKEIRRNALTNAKNKGETENTEQLARKMLEFIPRYTSEAEKKGKKVVTNDFISVSNGEATSGKKVQTTTLPKEITMNLLMKDRLDDLIRHLKPIERKDIVFLKFYLFSLEIAEKEYTANDYRIFTDECNDMLVRCGMSRLYPANRFENLILLSLLSSTPFDMFSDIIDYSFFNEPAPEK